MTPTPADDVALPDSTWAHGCPCPDPSLATASFCLTYTGEGAYAHVVHGGWHAMVRAFAFGLWTDGDPSHNLEMWREWLETLSDTDDEWLHDEGNQPSSIGGSLGETSNFHIYRLNQDPAAIAADRAKRAGLTDERIIDELAAWVMHAPPYMDDKQTFVAMARVIEAAHGITPPAPTQTQPEQEPAA